MAPLQIAATPVALLGTFLVGWAVMAFTAQIAASLLLADPTWLGAAAVGLPLSAVSVVLAHASPVGTVIVAVAVDAAAFQLVYAERYRTTALLVVVHLAATIAVVVLLSTVASLLAAAPA